MSLQDNGTLAHCTHHGSRLLPSQVACRKHSPAFLPSWRWHIMTNRTKSYFCLVDIGKTTDNLSITHLYIMDPYKLQEDLVPILRKTYHYLEDHEARPGSRCRTFPDFLWSWSVVGSFPVFPGPQSNCQQRPAVNTIYPKQIYWNALCASTQNLLKSTCCSKSCFRGNLQLYEWHQVQLLGPCHGLFG